MATEVLVTNGNTTVGTASGFYRAEAHNMSVVSSTMLALSSTRYIAFTPANAGNAKGIGIVLYMSTTSGGSVTCTLQQNTGSWVDVAGCNKTLTEDEITGGAAGGDLRGQFFTHFEFTTPAAVTTGANTWRVKVEQAAPGNWSLITSDATNPSYVFWCDNAKSFTDDDVVYAKDILTINQTCSFGGVLGTGDTTRGVSMWVGSQSADLTMAGAKLKTTGAAGMAVTFKGRICFGTHGGIQLGTTPHTVANQLEVIWATPAVGTVVPGIYGATGGTVGMGKNNFQIYGASPTYYQTTLANTANSGQKVLVTTQDMSSYWSAGDSLYVGKSATSGQGDSTIYVIDTIVGTTVTVTVNLATNNRTAGGYVVNLTRAAATAGVKFTNNTTASTIDLGGCSFFNIEGVYFDDTIVSPSSSTAGPNSDGAGNRAAHTFKNVVSYFSGTNGSIGLSSPWIPREGFTQQDCTFIRSAGGVTINGTYTSVCTSGSYRMINNVNLGKPSGYIGTVAAATEVYVENLVIQNAPASTGTSFSVGGTNGTFKDIYLYGFGGTFGQATVHTLINPVLISNINFDFGTYAIFCQSGVVHLNAVFKDCIFGATTPMTTADLVFGPGSYSDIEIQSPTGTLTVDTTNQTLMLAGSKVAITDENNVSGVDKVYTPVGIFTRCGDGLTDTTTHSLGTGKFSVRFQSTSATNLLGWIQTVPMGDMQGKSLTISVWVKINNSAYYGGTHTNPTLRVNYDDGTEETSVAANSTDWQELSVTFSPATSFNRVLVSIEGATDAAGTNAYFYVDDMSVVYPVGENIDFGSLDHWAGGLPIMPSISLSAGSSAPVASNLSMTDGVSFDA